MQKELNQLRRRPFMFPLLLPVAVAAVLVAAAIWFWDMRATTVVIAVRHAEVESTGSPDPDLSLMGQERAARLARSLAMAQGIRGVDAIYASEMRRTQQTVAPLAQSLSLPTNVLPVAGSSDLPRKLLREHRGKVVVVAGHSNTVPPLIEALSGEQIAIGETEFDHVYIVYISRLSRRRLLQLRY
jgi:broad specificity phosphatase PhoE